MEESQFLTWMKRKEIQKPHTDLLQAPLIGALNNSWEERAFAEDASRILNGFMWPPRSYSCSFCKREFRTAQALGGHMNVHRRDRARLKHCPNPSPHDENPSHHHHNDWKNSMDPQFSAEIFSKLDSFDLNPNNSRISAFPKQEISCGQTTNFPYSSSSSSLSWGQKNDSPDTKKDKNSQGLGQNICVETNLSVGLNSLFGRKLPTSSCGDEAISCKRAKIAASAVPNVLRPYPSDRSQALQSAELVIGLKKNGMEDLDLELRLGKLTQKV